MILSLIFEINTIHSWKLESSNYEIEIIMNTLLLFRVWLENKLGKWLKTNSTNVSSHCFSSLSFVVKENKIQSIFQDHSINKLTNSNSNWYEMLRRRMEAKTKEKFKFSHWNLKRKTKQRMKMYSFLSKKRRELEQRIQMTQTYVHWAENWKT